MGSPSDALGFSAAPATRVRYLVLGWLCLAALVAYLPRNSIGVAETTIRSDLGLRNLDLFGVVLTPADQMAQVMSAFFLTYAIFQLPAGGLAHVWGTRRALPLFAVAWSVAAALAALAQGFVWLLLTRLALGAAQAGIFSCTTLSVGKWFPITRRALASGALGSFMSIGGAMAAFLTGALLWVEVSWRWILFLYALPGVVWAAWFYLWFRDHPAEHRAVNLAELALLPADMRAGPEDRAGSCREPIPWRALLSSPAMWWICAQQFFRAAGYMFYASWFATYLQKTRSVPVGLSGILTSLPLFGVVLGSPLGGMFSDWMLARTGSRTLARKGVAAATQAASALLILLAYPVADAWSAVLILSAGSLCASVGAPCAYTITIEMGGRHVATVFSLMNMAGNVGAMVFPLLIPPLVRWQGWDPVLFVFSGIYLAAALCWLALDPKGTVFDRPGQEGR